MYSSAMTNGNRRQIGPSSQPSRAAPYLICDATRNQPAGTANILYLCSPVNSGVQPPQTAHFPVDNGAHSSGQMLYWLASAGPHQAVSSQQTVGGTTNSYRQALHSNQQNASTNVQSGNPCLPATYGANGNVNRDLTKLVLAYTTPATSVPRERTVCTSTLAPAHNRPSAHNRIHSQNSTPHGFLPSTHLPPPSYSAATSQFFRNNSIPTHSSSSGQMVPVSSTGKEAQRYPPQFSSAHNNGGVATNSSDSTVYGQYEIVNPAATQLQMPSHSVTADSLCGPYANVSDGRPPVYTSPPHRGQQFASDVSMTVSDQNMQPVTSAASESYNLNANQSFPHHSGQPLPKSSQSVTSRAQHIANAPPQQRFVPNALCVTATGDQRGGSKAENAHRLNYHRVSNRSLVRSLSDTSQVMQLPDSISPQQNMSQSSVANCSEILQLPSSVKPNDSPAHPSPGRSGTRAVAVVQPLSLESCQFASRRASSNNMTGEFLSGPEKVFVSPAVAKNGEAARLREESNVYPKNPNQMKSRNSVIRCSAGSSVGIVWSNSDSGPQNSTQNSELYINVEPAAKKSVPSELPVSQNCPKDQSGIETTPPPAPHVFGLSLLPTTPWTAVALTNLILGVEKAQTKPENLTETRIASQILNMFWDGKYKTMTSNLDCFRDVIRDAFKFCKTHVESDVLSQVKHGFEEQLKNYRVLKENEVYSELPYESSWLNVSEQLVDIDKEFGLPSTLKYNIGTFKSNKQTDQVKTANSIPAPIVIEVPDNVLSQTEPEPVDSGEEKQASTVEALSTQTASLSETESDNSSDSCYSFKIQILNPEKAKLVFEQVQSGMLQSMDTDDNQAEDVSSPVESETIEDTDAVLSESKVENGAVGPIEQVCCIARWMEIISGSSSPSSTCQCKMEQNHEGTDTILSKEDKAGRKDDNLCEIDSDSKFHPATEGQNLVKGKESIDDQIVIFSCPELCSERTQTIDLTDDDDKAHSSSDQEPKNAPQISISSQSSFILISDNEDEELSNSENETPNQMPDLCFKMSEPEDECAQEQLKSTATMQSSASDSGDKQTESEVPIQTSDHDDGQAQLKVADVGKSPLETKGRVSEKAAIQTSFSHCVKHDNGEGKRKSRSSHDKFLPSQQKSKKCKLSVDVDSPRALEGVSKCEKVFVDATEDQPLASNNTTVTLVLFGSTQQEKRAFFGDKKSSHSVRGSSETQRPPEVLSVTLGPLRKPSKTVYAGKYSVKARIHEQWRKSFPPTNIRHKNKLRTLKCPSAPLSEENLKEGKFPVSSKMSVLDGKPRRCLSLKKRALSNRLRLGEGDKKKYTVTLKTSADRLPKRNVLKFSLLPRTFNFEDGSSGRKECPDPDSDKPDPAEEKDQSSNKAVPKVKGTWYQNPEKKDRPPYSPPVLNTSSLFHKFQNKYKQRFSRPQMNNVTGDS